MKVGSLSIDQMIELPSADVMLLDNGFIHIHIKTEQEVTMDIAKAIAEARERLSNKISRLILYTSNSKIVIPSVSVRSFVASKERSKYIRANAGVIHSLPQKLIANFYLKMNQPSAPTMFFEDEQNAVDWLLSFENG